MEFFVFFSVLSCNDSAASSLCNQREELHHSWAERERQKRPKELHQLRPAALKKFYLKYPTLIFSQILSTALTLFPAYHQQMRQNTSLLKRRLAQRKNLASEIITFFLHFEEHSFLNWRTQMFLASVWSHLEVILLAGVQGVTAEVRLELYVIFKGLIGRREGHRGEKLNRQTTKQNKKRKTRRGQEKGRRRQRRREKWDWKC